MNPLPTTHLQPEEPKTELLGQGGQGKPSKGEAGMTRRQSQDPRVWMRVDKSVKAAQRGGGGHIHGGGRQEKFLLHWR